MQRSSWIVLSICLVLIIGLGIAYMASRGGPATLNQQEATRILKEMQVAVRHKNVGGIMEYIAPDDNIRIAHIRTDQLRMMIARAFHAMKSPEAEISNITFSGGTNDAVLSFDLKVHDDGPNMDSIPYAGRITLQLQRIPVTHLLGLYRTREWRIVGGSTTGPDPNNYGDY